MNAATNILFLKRKKNQNQSFFEKDLFKIDAKQIPFDIILFLTLFWVSVVLQTKHRSIGIKKRKCGENRWASYHLFTCICIRPSLIQIFISRKTSEPHHLTHINICIDIRLNRYFVRRIVLWEIFDICTRYQKDFLFAISAIEVSIYIHRNPICLV